MTYIVYKIFDVKVVKDYIVSCLFQNGEWRVIDLKNFWLNKEKITPSHPAHKLLDNKDLFDRIKVMGTTIGWEDTGIDSVDDTGNPVFYPLDIDPIVLHNNSVLDHEKPIVIGLSIKMARQQAGMTQAQLAQKSGVNKRLLSRLENNRGIDINILRKIIELGLGKKLNIQIH